MSETKIHASQIFPGSAYQLVGTNSAATSDTYLTLAGTSNEIIVTSSGTTITLSTPQAIGVGSSPTFAGLTNTGIAANSLVYSNGSQLLSAITLGTGLSLTGGTLNAAVTAPAAPVNSIQFNNAGVFGGTSALLWDNTNDLITITAPVAGGNSGLIITTVASTPDGNTTGGNITLTSGAVHDSGTFGAQSSDGGSITLSSGFLKPNTGASGTSVGGSLTLTSGGIWGASYTGPISTTGGSIILDTGDPVRPGGYSPAGSTTVNGGNITLTAGGGNASYFGDGGSILLTGTGPNGTVAALGHGNIYANWLNIGFESQSGGGILVSTINTSASGSPNVGGGLTLTTGISDSGGVQNTGGSILLTTGASTNGNIPVVGGGITLTSGSTGGGDSGGNLLLTSFTASKGGNISLTGTGSGHGNITMSRLTPNTVLIADGSQSIQSSSITTTTLGFLDATSSIQTQLNALQPAGNYITALTGDATATGPGSVPVTLATVNTNVGSFTNANITVNAKGLITAASNGSPGGVTSITGTANQITASASTGAVTLSLPSTVDITTLNLTNALSVANGGTGLATLTAHDVLVGAGTSNVTLVSPSTAGFILTSNGVASDPSFQAAPATTTVNTFSGAVSIVGTANEILVNNAAGTITLSTPQAIATTSNVQFGSLSLGGSADPSAILTQVSTTQGFLLPRMTTAQRDAISSPATGLEIYNTTTNQFEFYNGTIWTGVSSSTAFREDYIVGTPLNNYTGSTTVFNLVNAYNVGGHSLIVTLDGDVQTLGASADYLETNSTTVTFNNALVIGERVSFIFQTAVSSGGIVNSGTAGQLAYFATSGNTISGNTISVSNLFLADGSVAATGNFNLNSHKITNLANGTASTDAINLSQLTANGTVNSGTQYQMAYYATTGTAVSGDSSITTNASNQLLVTNGTIGAPGIAFSADPSTGITGTGAGAFNLVSGGQTAASISADQSVAIRGTSTNTNASAGYVGQYVQGTQSGNINAAASGVFDDLVSISLTAGDWAVSGYLAWESNGATGTQFRVGIGTASGNSDPGANSSVVNVYSTLPPGVGMSQVPLRFSFATTTTVYLKRYAAYTAGTPRTNNGQISAWRVR